MNKSVLVRLLICIFGLGLCLYSYIDKQNDLTEIRFRLPAIAREIKAIHEENTRLQYEIDRFENPSHLMELARRAEFSHLKQPLLKDVVLIRQGLALKVPDENKTEMIATVKPKLTIATIGALP